LNRLWRDFVQGTHHKLRKRRICIFFGLVTLSSIPHTNDSTTVGLIVLAWMALWLLIGLVSGSKRVEVNRLTYTVTVTLSRPWGSKTAHLALFGNRRIRSAWLSVFRPAR